MIRLAISVEGRTEEEFVNSVLASHLRPLSVEPTAVLIGRARSGSGGGNVSVDRLASDMVILYRNFDFVTSLVDFYGFRGKNDRTVLELEEHVSQEARTRIDRLWDQRKVIPYVQMHEFEGILFSDVAAFGTAIDAPTDSVRRLEEVRSQFPTPEDINDDPNTAPSKRIADAIPGYHKRLHGPLVAMDIGLNAIRGECRRFNEWLTRLESLGGPECLQP